MKLFEIHATEYNGEQEYSNNHILAAEDIDEAWQTAREYFSQWYDDGDEPDEHETDDPDRFEYCGGCIGLKIKGVGETTIEDWIRSRITYHTIGSLPAHLLDTDLLKVAKCALADIEGLMELLEIDKDSEDHPATTTRRELIKAIERWDL